LTLVSPRNKWCHFLVFQMKKNTRITNIFDTSELEGSPKKKTTLTQTVVLFWCIQSMSESARARARWGFILFMHRQSSTVCVWACFSTSFLCVPLARVDRERALIHADRPRERSDTCRVSDWHSRPYPLSCPHLTGHCDVIHLPPKKERSTELKFQSARARRERARARSDAWRPLGYLPGLLSTDYIQAVFTLWHKQLYLGDA
jgi:hypothetical protein